MSIVSIRTVAGVFLLSLVLAGCGSTSSAKPGEATVLPPPRAIEETDLVGFDGGGFFRVWEIGRQLPADARLTRLTFIHSGLIDGVIARVSLQGKQWESPRFGVGEVGRKTETTIVDLDWGESIRSIDVLTGRKPNGAQVITRLVLRTNKKTVEIGEKTGELKGTVLCPGSRRVVGICGRQGWYLDSIGFQTVE